MFHCAFEHSGAAAVLRPVFYPRGRVAYESGEFWGRDENECARDAGDCDHDRSVNTRVDCIESCGRNGTSGKAGPDRRVRLEGEPAAMIDLRRHREQVRPAVTPSESEGTDEEPVVSFAVDIQAPHE